MIRDLIRRGECGPFVSGFLIFGTIGFFVVTIFVVGLPSTLLDPLVPILGQIIESTKGSLSVATAVLLWLIVAALILSLPQLLFALIGGEINRRLSGFKIVTARGRGQT
jgi:hypothetical protein